MRQLIKFTHATNMFGHSYSYEKDQKQVSIIENAEHAWHMKHQRVTKPYFWFRAPNITLQALQITMRDLGLLEHKFELKVWQSDKGLDASLKIKDEMDASMWAWSHTEIWAKWSEAQEKDWNQGQKPQKLKVNKNGQVKIKVTMSEISDP